MERRLQQRFLKLVHSHMRSAHALAAGVASMPNFQSAFAGTQAAWRFLNNDRVTLPALVAPLREIGVGQTQQIHSQFVMLVHDWSKLTFKHPRRKQDLAQRTHAADIGYELTTALLVNPDNGAPIAPMELHLKTAQGMVSTRRPRPQVVHHNNQVLPTMKASGSWGLARPVVHVIDQELDSVDHFRQWAAKGHKFLVRAGKRRVCWRGKSHLLTEISQELKRQNQLRHVGTVSYQGKGVPLWVAETEVVLNRPARKHLQSQFYRIPGRPLTLRFLIVQVHNEQGETIAEWMLLSNVPLDWASTEHLAYCYYWRWRIESFFKLLKGHGHQIEYWQQATGIAIARRLLVASMACVVVWQLQEDNSKDAIELKKTLVRLSGRQMKRSRPYTAPALLAGLWTLLSMLELMAHKDLRQLKRLAQQYLSFDTG
jgi:hypothetical protein